MGTSEETKGRGERRECRGEGERGEKEGRGGYISCLLARLGYAAAV